MHKLALIAHYMGLTTEQAAVAALQGDAICICTRVMKRSLHHR